MALKRLFFVSVAFAFAITISCSSEDDDKNNISSSSNAGSCGTYNSLTHFCDERDDALYKFVDINGQMWMAENLNYNASGSKCYGEGSLVYDNNDNYVDLSPAEIQANCEIYGRLYNWTVAMDLPNECNDNVCIDKIQEKHQGICPEGWHLPTDEEWDALCKFVDSSYDKDDKNYYTPQGYRYVVGKHLKAQSGWIDCGPYDEDYQCLDTYGFSALPGGEGLFCDGCYFQGVGKFGNWWSATEGSINAASAWSIEYFSDTALWLGSSLAKRENLFSIRCVKD